MNEGLARKSTESSLFKPQLFVRQGVTEADIVELKTSFDLLDVHGTGVLDLADTIDSIESLGIRRVEQEPLMLAIRACEQAGGKASFADFVDVLAPMLVTSDTSQESLRRAWRLIDEGEKGHVRLEDLMHAARAHDLDLCTDALQDMIEYASTRGNEDITYEEFYAVLARRTRV